MSLSLRMILLTVAMISLCGIIIEGIRRKRVRAQAKFQRYYQTPNVIDDYDDGIVAEPRVIKPADPSYQRVATGSPLKFKSKIAKNPKLGKLEPEPVPYLQQATQTELIVFYIMPENHQKISGRQLKNTLLDLGFEYGNKRIFSFYEKNQDRKILQFCLASAFEPGTFDITQMFHQEFGGLCCFMSVSHPQADRIFKVMLTILEEMVELLQVKLCDDQRQPCTQVYLKQCQQRITKVQ